MLFNSTTSLLPQIEAGTLRALAVTDDTRISQLPEVPTTAEAGFPAIQGAFWTGIVAPVRTPAAIVVRTQFRDQRHFEDQRVGAQPRQAQRQTEGRLA